MNKSLITYLLIGLTVSCYFFPFEFTFLPKGLNTKILLSVLGVLFYGLHSIQAGRAKVDRDVLIAAVLAFVFSLEGWISVDLNASTDYAYSNYIISFGTWLGAAYAAYRIMLWGHGYVDFKLLIHYLIGVCVLQCALALAIDMIEPLKYWVNLYIAQDTVANVEFLEKVNRLYGIGAAIDVAGTRFSVVLLGIAAMLIQELQYKRRTAIMVLYWVAFIFIVGVGNMISRTTTIGTILSLVYLLFGSGILHTNIKESSLKLWGIFVFVSIGLFLLGTYFYHTNDNIKELLRFGFEGFFNWVEKGEWKTDSTDRLNTVMWNWPDNADWQTWIIGKADFSWAGTKTDIGYCRFVFYGGLVGLTTFSLFFVYNAWACAQKFPQQQLFFLFLLAMGFIVWLKVATDLFLIYALFYCLDKERGGSR